MGVAQVPGQQYGAQVEQQQLQKTMPAPKDQTSKAVAQAAQQGARVPQMQQQRSQAPDPMQLAAQLRDRVGILGQGTTRPQEPVTAGLTRGPGPGPEVLGLRRRSPLGELMRSLSRETGDPYLASLADRANL